MASPAAIQTGATPKHRFEAPPAPPSPPSTASDHEEHCLQNTYHDRKHDSKDENDEYNALISSLPSTATAPLWEQMAALNPRAPRPTSVPHIWRYGAVRSQLLRAGRVVPEEKAERRVLMFVNPQREAPYTTDTLYAGLQLVNPGEVAPAHRHIAVATRFVLEAPSPMDTSPSTAGDETDTEPQTAFTAIQTRRIPMAVHDLIVTPRWTWHDHGNRGASPVIWLDGLDLPSFQHVPVHFVEHYAQSRYPSAEAKREECGWVVPWARMKAILDDAAAERGEQYVERRYSKPDGGEITATLGALAARIEAGVASPAKRETSSAVWNVVAGSGRTDVDGAVMRWEKGDTIAVPAWTQWRHIADGAQEEGDGAAYLFRFDDMPMLKTLGWYRVEGDDLEALAEE